MNYLVGQVRRNRIGMADKKIYRMDSEMAGTLKVTLTKSEIGSTKKIRATLGRFGAYKKRKDHSPQGYT